MAVVVLVSISGGGVVVVVVVIVSKSVHVLTSVFVVVVVVTDSWGFSHSHSTVTLPEQAEVFHESRTANLTTDSPGTVTFQTMFPGALRVPMVISEAGRGLKTSTETVNGGFDPSMARVTSSPWTTLVGVLIVRKSPAGSGDPGPPARATVNMENRSAKVAIENCMLDCQSLNR